MQLVGMHNRYQHWRISLGKIIYVGTRPGNFPPPKSPTIKRITKWSKLAGIEEQNWDWTNISDPDHMKHIQGCKVIDESMDGHYSTPVEAEGKDETFISRIREDKTIKNGLNLWIVSDNLLRGAALNSVEIAESLIKNNFYGK
mgnify:CR=1 FL=1